MLVEKGDRRDSNPRRPGPQPGALPTELRPPSIGFSGGILAVDWGKVNWVAKRVAGCAEGRACPPAPPLLPPCPSPASRPYSSGALPLISSVMIITIDGPAGTGKSTVARQVADRLGFAFLDTGAMYRAIGLEALRRQADLEDPRG